MWTSRRWYDRRFQEIGYNDATHGFDSNTCAVISTINKQSPDIAQGVDTGGAGDQGMMFGYATNETPELMPTPISLAHRLAEKLSEVRKSGKMAYLRPDGKSQVTVEYDSNHKPVRVDAVVISTQHAEEVGNDQLRAEIQEYVIEAVIPAELLDENTKYHINPTGPLRDRRTHGRYRADGAEDYCRHLWRHGPAWRRRILRQGLRPRWTARRPIWRGMWRRTSSLRVWRTGARFSWLTRSASRSR